MATSMWSVMAVHTSILLRITNLTCLEQCLHQIIELEWAWAALRDQELFTALLQ